ncbi:MAG TPA: cytochrome C oxidase subunit IV family protein [Candidatus Saccharimonadales bacterium]|nr:cytochrome C oxidase subunit IV family protein [Candidatus Saccharimonadales bacterium]
MKSVVAEHGTHHPLKLTKYIGGFIASVALTMLAYVLVTRSTLDHNTVIFFISGLAVAQFAVQMILFLHVGEETGSRWKLATALLMLMIVVLVVFGSWWIMNNLNNRMTLQQTEQYLKSQDSL